MKKFFRSIVAFFLGLLARAVVHRYRPRIVMVTGSVGKTSTKDAAAAALAARFHLRKSEKSFNSEFGVPFTIFGVGNPWLNPLAWLRIIRSVIALLFLPNHYPNLLVLETGADRPGDLARMLKIATPDMVVVTRLPEIPVHVEAYPSPEAVQEEEFSPALALAAEAPLIVSSEDSYACTRAARMPARVITYGEATGATVRMSAIDFHTEAGNVIGMRATLRAGDVERQTIVVGSVGRTQVLPVAAAVAAALALEIPLEESVQALENLYEPPPGRGRLFEGVNGSVIIDDSYNSSPVAVEEALTTLRAFPGAKRRVAILGDMLELGRYSVTEHRRIADLAARSADLVAAVGVRARACAGAANAEVLTFENSRVAAEALPSIIKEGDVVLVKGSQSIRMERVVEALLAHQADIPKLVRQEEKWKKRA